MQSLPRDHNGSPALSCNADSETTACLLGEYRVGIRQANLRIRLCGAVMNSRPQA